MKDGKQTSEHKMAWVVMAANLVIAMGGMLVTLSEGTPWAAVVAAAIAGANAVVSAKYSQSRAVVKASAADPSRP
jgi:hypothetical protein